jgi:hypothetical protein
MVKAKRLTPLQKTALKLKRERLETRRLRAELNQAVVQLAATRKHEAELDAALTDALGGSAVTEWRARVRSTECLLYGLTKSLRSLAALTEDAIGTHTEELDSQK